jgi:hypothetical protein
MKLLFAVFLSGTCLLFAQDAVVSGRVSDSSQAVVPGARVEIVNIATNIANRTTANEVGYSLRVNMSETLLTPLISEEGGKEYHHEKKAERCTTPCGFGVIPV